LGTLWRDSEGVRRGADRGLRRVWGVKKENKRKKRVEKGRAGWYKFALESWREAFEGWRNWRKRAKGRKRGEEGEERAWGGRFSGKVSGNPQTARSDKDLFRPKPETATRSGAITYPFLPLAYAHMCGFGAFLYNNIDSLVKNINRDIYAWKYFNIVLV